MQLYSLPLYVPYSLCTYYQLESIGTGPTFPPRCPLSLPSPVRVGAWIEQGPSLPALPSVLQCISHSGVAPPLRVGGAAAKVFLRRAPCSIQAPLRMGDGKRRGSVCPSPEGCQIRLTLLVMSSCRAFVQGGWFRLRGYFSGQYVIDKNLTILSFMPHSFICK